MPAATRKSGRDLLLLLNAAGPPADDDPEILATLLDEEGRDVVHMKAEDQVVVPFLKLLQGQSPPVQEGRAKPGNWWHSDREVDLGQRIVVVPVFMFMTRARWAPVESGESTPLCKSGNFRVGVGDPGGDCETCPQRKRWIARGEKRPVGDCDECYNMILWLIEHEMVAMAIFSRTGSAAGRQLTRLVASTGRGRRCYSFAYTMSSEQRKNVTNQIYHVPKVDVFPTGQRRQSLARPEFKSLTEQLGKEADDLARMYDEGRLVPTFEDVAEGSEENTAGGEEDGSFDHGANVPSPPADPEKPRADASDFA